MAKPSLAWRLKRPVTILLVAIGLPLLAGIAWVIFEGGDTRNDLASAFFIGGAVIVVGAAATGGGAQGQRLSAARGDGGAPNAMPFAAIFVAAIVIGLGVLVLKA